MPAQKRCTLLRPNCTRYTCCAVLLLACALLSLLPLPVHADGGAPNLAYVAGAGHGIEVIDIAQQKLLHNFSVGGDPHMILLSSDGAILYVAQPTLGQVSELVARTGRVLCTSKVSGQPTLLALSADGTRLYVAGGASTQVTVLNTATCGVQQTYQTNEDVSGLAVTIVVFNNEIRNQLWIAGTTTLTVITEQEQQIERIPIPGGPRFLCLSGGLTAYIATRQGNIVAVDMASYQVFARFLTGGNFGPMDYDATTGQIYVPDQQHDQLDILSPVHMGTLITPHEPERVLPLHDAPQSIAITSDGQLGFIALRNGQVSMLDVPEHQLLHTFAVGGTPQFIITGLYPPTTDPTPRQVVKGFAVPVAALVLLIVGLLTLFISTWLLLRRHVGTDLSRPFGTRPPKRTR